LWRVIADATADHSVPVFEDRRLRAEDSDDEAVAALLVGSRRPSA
jgi:hypothetical protein